MMSPREIDIADMQCWLLRMAQKKWGIGAGDCARLLSEHGAFDFIENNYDILHLSSYDCALQDVEVYLESRGVSPC